MTLRVWHRSEIYFQIFLPAKYRDFAAFFAPRGADEPVMNGACGTGS
jgi:hypothetical protein